MSSNFSDLPPAGLTPVEADASLSTCDRCGTVVVTSSAWGYSAHARWHEAVENTGQEPTPEGMGSGDHG